MLARHSFGSDGGCATFAIMPVPVVSVAQMREWEQGSWAAGRSQTEVIGRAGQAVAARALQLTAPEDRILVLAGKGHNGDDARCAQPHLVDRKVRMLSIADPAHAQPEVEGLLAKKPALIIDGLFGIGLKRDLDPAWRQLIGKINDSALPVLAVDVPSGLNADNGEVAGDAIRARHTLTLAAPKRGLLKPASYPYVGRLEVAPDIGLIPCPLTSDLQWTLARDFAGGLPARPVDGHKGHFGHLGILAGSLGYHGAAILAARGALRAQPGLVSLFCPEAVYQPVASQLQAAMVHPCGASFPLLDLGTAWLIGPGMADRNLAPSVRSFAIDLWLNCSQPVVADASALDWLPEAAPLAGAIRVITPHPGEAARLLGIANAEVQADRFQAVRRLSQRFAGAWVVLKGHQTMIGRKEGEIFVNGSGNPTLAQGGSGDVLAGYVAGLLAQPDLQHDVLEAIRFGVWQHGATADLLSQRHAAWTIEELVQLLGSAEAA